MESDLLPGQLQSSVDLASSNQTLDFLPVVSRSEEDAQEENSDHGDVTAGSSRLQKIVMIFGTLGHLGRALPALTHNFMISRGKCDAPERAHSTCGLGGFATSWGLRLDLGPVSRDDLAPSLTVGVAQLAPSLTVGALFEPLGFYRILAFGRALAEFPHPER